MHHNRLRPRGRVGRNARRSRGIQTPPPARFLDRRNQMVRSTMLRRTMLRRTMLRRTMHRQRMRHETCRVRRIEEPTIRGSLTVSNMNREQPSAPEPNNRERNPCVRSRHNRISHGLLGRSNPTTGPTGAGAARRLHSRDGAMRLRITTTEYAQPPREARLHPNSPSGSTCTAARQPRQEGRTSPRAATASSAQPQAQPRRKRRAHLRNHGRNARNNRNASNRRMRNPRTRKSKSRTEAITADVYLGSDLFDRDG
jgi:hypothetical protein